MPGPKFIYEAELFKAISHPTRIEILQLLRDGEKCVCDIVPALEKEQSNVSRHLGLLRKEGILSSRKDGLKMIYRVEDPRVFELIDTAREILKKCWEEKREMLL